MVDSNGTPAPVAPERRASDGDDGSETDAPADQPERRPALPARDPTDDELTADVVACRTCGASIGHREYRLTHVIETERTTVERHYCDAACVPDDAPRDGDSSPAEKAAANRDSARTERAETTADRSKKPRDWSYCR